MSVVYFSDTMLVFDLKHNSFKEYPLSGQISLIEWIFVVRLDQLHNLGT